MASLLAMSLISFKCVLQLFSNEMIAGTQIGNAFDKNGSHLSRIGRKVASKRSAQ
jgi:hypothetical protein